MTNPQRFGIGGFGVLALLILLVVVKNVAEAQLNRKEKEARRAYRGAKAEEQIGDILESLWGTFNSSAADFPRKTCIIIAST